MRPLQYLILAGMFIGAVAVALVECAVARLTGEPCVQLDTGDYGENE